MRITRLIASSAAAAALVLSGFAATPAAATATGDTQGCTPGYWKNHTDVWQEYTADEAVTQMLRDKDGTPFTMPAGLSQYGGISMLDALKLKGGSGATGGAEILLRAATAGILNAAYDVVPDGSQGLFYPYRRYGGQTINGVHYPALIPAVQAALNSGDKDTMVNLASKIDAANNLGCPLN
jgi:hypothetical protein